MSVSTTHATGTDIGLAASVDTTMTSASKSAANQGHGADMVIKFEGMPQAYAEGRKRAPMELLEERAQELERLMERLREVGLSCISRAGPRVRGQVLIFVRCPEHLLRQMRHSERVHDFLHGVVTSSRLNQDEAFKPAQRVRYTQIRIAAPYKDSPQKHRGAGISPKCAEFPHVMDMLPLHDKEFNRAWISSWSKMSLSSFFYGIGQHEFDKLRDQFGVDIAMYFSFLNTYFLALAPISVLGLIFWASDQTYNRMYAFLLIVWATVFVEIWRIRERMLAVHWGMTGVSSVSQRHEGFRPRTTTRSAITGESEEVFENWRRDARFFSCLPITILFIVLLLCTMSVLFLIEIVVTEVYDGPGKSFVPLVPTVLFSTCIPIIQSAWRAAAQAMTDFENHATANKFRASLTFKIFGMQSVVTYGILALTAYIYIPFGEFLINQLYQKGYLTRLFSIVSNGTYEHKGSTMNFRVSPNRLHAQLFAMCVTEQITDTASEVLLPMVIRYFDRLMKRFRRPASVKARRAEFAKTNPDQEFLERVQNEFDLDVYDEFTDYAEMATQLGVIVLWSVLWPLAPVMGLVNNFFELRSDAYKLVINMRRPFPRRVESIGSWMSVLSILVQLSVFTNASMLFMFDALKPNSKNPLRPRDASISHRIRLWIVSFTFALMCNQLYSLIHSLIRHIIERSMWANCDEDISIRRRLHMNRVALIERFEHAASPRELETLSSSKPASHDPFWDLSSDTGISYIRNASKEA